MMQVTDTNGCKYTLGRCLGRGGQGTVYEVQHSKLAVKVLSDASTHRHEQLRNQLTQVRRLALSDVPIAKPLEMLRSPQVGYVMEMITGMVPLRALAEVPPNSESNVGWYLHSGGLRRRLNVLARAADILNELHVRGLVYSDISPNNIFISEEVGVCEVWLIDADNLRYQSVPCSGTYYTPRYAAPEVAEGHSGVNSLSDAFGFAVLAFETLAIVHPFIGDLVTQGEPELEKQAFAGKLPWIDDEKDRRNQSTCGVPREIVLSPRLRELFARTFSDGISVPASRPGISELADRLHTAAEATVVCTNCNGSFYSSDDTCPWCGAPRPTYLVCAFGLFDPERQGSRKLVTRPTTAGERPLWTSRLCLSDGESFELTSRQIFGHYGLQAERPIVRLQLDKRKLSILRVSEGAEQIVVTDGTNSKRLKTDLETIPLTAKEICPWRIHFGSARELHRFATFKLQLGISS